MTPEEGATKNNENGKVTFSTDTRAMPLFPAGEATLEGKVLEKTQVSETAKQQKPSNESPPPPLPELAADNVSLAASEVVLRHPTSQNMRSQLKHSSSTSDIIRLRNAYRPNKESKSMVLPFNRPRSPFLPMRSNISSFDGGSQMTADSAYGVSNPNLDSEQFSPYVPGANGVFPYPNGGGYGDYNGGGYGHFNGRPKTIPSVDGSVSSHHHTMPTPSHVKKKIFSDILATALSTIYAILIVTLGVSFYVIDLVQIENDNLDYLAEGFSFAVLLLALLYLSYLCIDIAIYTHRKKKLEKHIENMRLHELELTETKEGVAYDASLHKAMTLNRQIDHRYCFNNDRHSSNFYLKVGAAGFCFGHLIHSVLILAYRGIILRSDEHTSPECMSVITFIIEILHPLYSIILLFFIFKYSNVIINKNRVLHRFGSMHCLAANLCFWFWTIFRETSEYIQNSSYPDDYETSVELNTTAKPVGIIVPFRFTAMCEHEELNVIYQNYSPYLYPFSVEYSILVVGILYIVWNNIGLCAPTVLEHDEHSHGEDTRECRNERRASEPESNVTIHADCHASNKGIFLGFIVLMFSIVSLILFFITYYSETSGLPETGLVVNESTRLVIMILMGVAVVFAYFQMSKLDFNEIAHNSLDNFLCLMCLPAFFVYGSFSIIPGIIFGRVLAVTGITLEVIQVVIQTTFIIDGMSRSSNTKVLRKKKPGREFVIFLVICNVSMWILQTFEVKSHGLDQYRQVFYSSELWSVIGHMCLPLMMFYRFHSSVCIADIWKYAYMPAGH